MTETDRLERRVAEAVGECCEGDVQRRVETLREYGTDGPADPEGDLRALATLGDETRYTIARLLAAAPEELCVCEIEPVVDVSDSAVSHALSDLHEAGLVERRKEGTWRYYRTTERAAALLAALDETRAER